MLPPLVDVERIGRPGNQRFVGVFSPGDGAGKLSRARILNDSVGFVLAQTQNGRRTRDMEMFVVGQTDDGNGGGQTSGNAVATYAGLPNLPPCIELSDNPQLGNHAGNRER